MTKALSQSGCLLGARAGDYMAKHFVLVNRQMRWLILDFGFVEIW